MKRCELCKRAARMFCESDQASLCWDCDAKVHSANFLVARHSRRLLCHVCQSPTSWNASGSKLEPTVSVCESCVNGCEGLAEDRNGGEVSGGGYGGEVDTEDDGFDGYEDEEEEDEDEDEEEQSSGDDEDGDNQVVPWSSTPPPPPATSSSSSDESSTRFCKDDAAVSLERLRDESANLRYEDDNGCSSCHRHNTSPPPPADWLARGKEAAFVDSLRPLKRQRTEPSQTEVQRGPPSSRTALIIESLKRFHEQDLTSGNNAAEAIVRICKLSKNPGAIDLDSAESQ